MAYLTGMIKWGSTSSATTALIDPVEFSVQITDIDNNTKRNAAGNIVRRYVTTKRIIDCKWGYLTQSQSNTLLTYFNSATYRTFYLNYPDPVLGYVTKQFYVDKKTIPMFRMQNSGSTLIGYWENLSVTFIEV